MDARGRARLRAMYCKIRDPQVPIMKITVILTSTLGDQLDVQTGREEKLVKKSS